MKILRETNDKESSFPKHKAKTIAPKKQSVVYTILQILKLKFKEIKDRDKAHRGLYWFTLNSELHPVFS